MCQPKNTSIRVSDKALSRKSINHIKCLIGKTKNNPQEYSKKYPEEFPTPTSKESTIDTLEKIEDSIYTTQQLTRKIYRIKV